MAGHNDIAEVEQRAPQGFEWAARVVYESYNGDGAWGHANSQQRSHARQCVRQLLSTLGKHGVRFDVSAGGAPAAAPPAARVAASLPRRRG